MIKHTTPLLILFLVAGFCLINEDFNEIYGTVEYTQYVNNTCDTDLRIDAYYTYNGDVYRVYRDSSEKNISIYKNGELVCKYGSYQDKFYPVVITFYKNKVGIVGYYSYNPSWCRHRGVGFILSLTDCSEIYSIPFGYTYDICLGCPSGEYAFVTYKKALASVASNIHTTFYIDLENNTIIKREDFLGDTIFETLVNDTLFIYSGNNRYVANESCDPFYVPVTYSDPNVISLMEEPDGIYAVYNNGDVYKVSDYTISGNCSGYTVNLTLNNYITTISTINYTTALGEDYRIYTTDAIYKLSSDYTPPLITFRTYQGSLICGITEPVSAYCEVTNKDTSEKITFVTSTSKSNSITIEPYYLEIHSYPEIDAGTPNNTIHPEGYDMALNDGGFAPNPYNSEKFTTGKIGLVSFYSNSYDIFFYFRSYDHYSELYNWDTFTPLPSSVITYLYAVYPSEPSDVNISIDLDLSSELYMLFKNITLEYPENSTTWVRKSYIVDYENNTVNTIVNKVASINSTEITNNGTKYYVEIPVFITYYYNAEGFPFNGRQPIIDYDVDTKLNIVYPVWNGSYVYNNETYNVGSNIYYVEDYQKDDWGFKTMYMNIGVLNVKATAKVSLLNANTYTTYLTKGNYSITCTSKGENISKNFTVSTDGYVDVVFSKSDYVGLKIKTKTGASCRLECPTGSYDTIAVNEYCVFDNLPPANYMETYTCNLTVSYFDQILNKVIWIGDLYNSNPQPGMINPQCNLFVTEGRYYTYDIDLTVYTYNITFNIKDQAGNNKTVYYKFKDIPYSGYSDKPITIKTNPGAHYITLYAPSSCSFNGLNNTTKELYFPESNHSIEISEMLICEKTTFTNNPLGIVNMFINNLTVLALCIISIITYLGSRVNMLTGGLLFITSAIIFTVIGWLPSTTAIFLGLVGLGVIVYVLKNVIGGNE